MSIGGIKQYDSVEAFIKTAGKKNEAKGEINIGDTTVTIKSTQPDSKFKRLLNKLFGKSIDIKYEILSGKDCKPLTKEEMLGKLGELKTEAFEKTHECNDECKFMDLANKYNTQSTYVSGAVGLLDLYFKNNSKLESEAKGYLMDNLKGLSGANIGEDNKKVIDDFIGKLGSGNIEEGTAMEVVKTLKNIMEAGLSETREAFDPDNKGNPAVYIMLRNCINNSSEILGSVNEVLRATEKNG